MQCTHTYMHMYMYTVTLTHCMQTLFMLTLPFSCVYSCTAELTVSSCDGGGVWKFPVQLTASTAEPDDVIIIEAAGLNKESQIQFRLTSLQE